jgi:[ribosomal protein S5]-alanine N-acetyltransferase
VELTTPRLHLRPFTLADHEAIHLVYADPDVMRYVGHGAHRTLAETANALRIYGDVLTQRGYSFLAVTERETGALIGDGGLHPMGGIGPDVELGYTLARSAWGRGYATELGQALVEYAFTTLRVPRVVAQVEPANTGSRHVLEKLGMTPRQERMAYGRPHLLYAVEAAAPATPPAALRGSSPPR